MIRNGEASLDGAAARLARAIEALEARVQALKSAPPPAASDAGETDALHAELRETRQRERALEAAAAEASTVLGRAAEQIRAALSEEDEDAGADEAVVADADADEVVPSLEELSDDQTDMHPSSAREF